GHVRKPVPRFSVINDDPKERENVYNFFFKWGLLANKILVPGGHIFIASTPLLSDILSLAMRDAGFERRGEIIRTVCTLRGGDRPKGAEEEFPYVSVIPRGLWEPWGLYRKPISEKTVAENLRRWYAGALRRDVTGSPMTDLIKSEKTSQEERKICNHPSLKPQNFLRKIVYASLPIGKGIIYDPFAGGGSTLAAAESLGIVSIGTEVNKEYYECGLSAIPLLTNLHPQQKLF
ncbi:MAG: site-specific DNA-methyltransferase, partial [Oscillospiraceae bacterium]|nr:site-specific DNA-methyltransferase [Oscillospiraceae bacterium]